MRLLYTLFFVVNIASAQQTWLQSFDVINYPPGMHWDSTFVGPREVCVTPNGKFIYIMQVDENGGQILVEVDSVGNIQWQRESGFHGGIQSESSTNLHSTSDNGCIFSRRHSGSGIVDSVLRVDASGQNVWSKRYMFQSGVNGEIINSLIQTSYNTTIIQFQDSLVELDSNGQFIQNRFPYDNNARLFPLGDSTFLEINSGFASRVNFAGVQQWSTGIYGNKFTLSADTSTGYIWFNDSISKINVTNGSILWTANINNMYFSVTDDLGFITALNNDFSKYDSYGTLEWTKPMPLPEFGIKTIAETRQNSFIIGGAWKMIDVIYYELFRSLLFTIDSAGNGVCDSTHYFFAGNANDNSLLNFADDAVYIAAAMGTAGVPRIPALYDPFTYPSVSLGKSLFATDWSTGFPAGYNHKFSDVDGNGILDTADIGILSYAPTFLMSPVFPHWQRLANTIPSLHLHIPSNHLNLTDPLEIDMILGSPSGIIDSIYGLSMELTLASTANLTNNYSSRSLLVPASSLGDSAVNLYSYLNYDPNEMGCRTNLILCRTDHQNAVVTGDTIAKLFFDLSTQTGIDTIYLNVTMNAITEGGFPVGLNITSDTAFFNNTTSTNELNANQFSVYPNPADNSVSIKTNLTDTKNIRLTDLAGRVIFTENFDGENILIDLKNYATGIYNILISTSEGSYKSKLIISR